jgi:membrane-associated phospholipid phosphatase
MNHPAAQLHDAIGHLSAIELRIVRAAYARSTRVQAVAVAIDRFGTFWIYPVLAIVCFGFVGADIAPVILVALLSAALAHCIYPALKKRLARPRPYKIDPTLDEIVPALDEYALPSGHVMTLTSALVPLVAAFPQFLAASIVLWAAIAWARIALAHHYPSDVAAGGVLAAIIAGPISIYVF